MSTKRLFQVLDEMNVNDEKNKTATCAVCFQMVSANKSKGGGLVTMGVPDEAIQKIFIGEYTPILVLMDKKEYERLNQTKMALPKKTQDRITSDAEDYAIRMVWVNQNPKGEEQLFYEYISDTSYQAGANAVAERAQKLVEALEQIANNTGWQNWQAQEVAKSTLKQWSAGKTARPCPHCGKELNRDRNLCCRECGKEVISE